jgi:hypothetical protein
VLEMSGFRASEAVLNFSEPYGLALRSGQPASTNDAVRWISTEKLLTRLSWPAESRRPALRKPEDELPKRSSFFHCTLKFHRAPACSGSLPQYKHKFVDIQFRC